MTQNSLPWPKMIYIPGGKYRMGERAYVSDFLMGGTHRKDKRGNIVTVQDFWMDETPVTVAQYREAVIAGAVSRPEDTFDSNYYRKGKEDHPVNCVEWLQMKAYATWAGKRLPTEEEWEWAARGGVEAREYPWGNEPPNDQLLCWNRWGENKRNSTSPVGSYPKGDSKHGLKDMAGNVWEWTSSIYLGSTRSVGCGGCWYTHSPDDVRVSNRYYNQSTIRSGSLGFRCVRDV